MRDHVNSAKKRREYVNQRCYGGGGGGLLREQQGEVKMEEICNLSERTRIFPFSLIGTFLVNLIMIRLVL